MGWGPGGDNTIHIAPPYDSLGGGGMTRWGQEHRDQQGKGCARDVTRGRQQCSSLHCYLQCATMAAASVASCMPTTHQWPIHLTAPPLPSTSNSPPTPHLLAQIVWLVWRSHSPCSKHNRLPPSPPRQQTPTGLHATPTKACSLQPKRVCRSSSNITTAPPSFPSSLCPWVTATLLRLSGPWCGTVDSITAAAGPARLTIGAWIIYK